MCCGRLHNCFISWIALLHQIFDKKIRQKFLVLNSMCFHLLHQTNYSFFFSSFLSVWQTLNYCMYGSDGHREMVGQISINNKEKSFFLIPIFLHQSVLLLGHKTRGHKIQGLERASKLY